MSQENRLPIFLQHLDETITAAAELLSVLKEDYDLFHQVQGGHKNLGISIIGLCKTIIGSCETIIDSLTGAKVIEPEEDD